MSSIRVLERDFLAPREALDGAFARERLVPSRAVVEFVAAVGRVGIVLTAVLTPVVASAQLDYDTFLAVAVVAAVWLVILRATCAAFDGLLGTMAASSIGASLALGALVAVHPLLPAYRPTALDLTVTAVGVVVSTAIWEWAVRTTGATRRRVLVVGRCETSEVVARELEGCSDYEIVGRVGEPDRSRHPRVPLSGGLAALAAVVEAQQPDVIVLTDERSYGDALDRLLERPGARGRVVGLPGFFEHALRRVPVEHLTPAWFMSLVHLRQPIYGRWTKRAFDILAAGVGVVLALPVMALVAVIVSCSRGPLFYRQTRLGESGRPFTIVKFRTMVPDAERNGRPSFASLDDTRLIPGGKLLRRTHLDELPQFWNVLRGEMSIVGPRPERPEIASALEDEVPFWNRRLLVKPGVTGWAQISCGYVADCAEMADKLAYDLWYLRNQSLVVDVAICIRTVGQQVAALIPGLPPAKGAAR